MQITTGKYEFFYKVGPDRPTLLEVTHRVRQWSCPWACLSWRGSQHDPPMLLSTQGDQPWAGMTELVVVVLEEGAGAAEVECAPQHT